MSAHTSNFSQSTGEHNVPPIALENPHHKTATSGAVAVPIYCAYERRESALSYAWQLMKHRERGQHPVIGVVLLGAMLLLLAIFCIAIDPAAAQEVQSHAAGGTHG